MLSVVPDGVARVRWGFPRQYNAHTRLHPRPLVLNVAVRSNIAIARYVRQGIPSTVSWYAADGHLIERYGNQASLTHVYQRR